jgi:hypothetical protein
MKEYFRDLPPAVQQFNIVLPLLFLATATWAVTHSTPAVVVCLSTIFALTYLVEPTPNPSGGRIFPNNSVKIVAALLWSPSEVLLGIGIGSFLGLILFRGYEVWRAGGNGAGWGLSAGVATLVAHLVIPRGTPSLANLGVAAVLAVATNRITNEGIFSVYRSKRFGHPFLATWMQNIFDQWPSQLFAAPIGVALAAIGVHLASTSWGLALTAVSAIALPIPRQELAYYHRSQQILTEIVEAVVRTLEGMDPEARAHGDRVSALTVAVGRRLGMSEQQLRALALAARLHDVGMLAGSKGESAQDHHAAVGGRILSRFPDPLIAAIVRAHHERWDGKGLPDHLHGTVIPLGARILAAVEIYDSSVAGLPPFEAPLTKQAASSHLISLAGTVLDPKIVMALLAVASGQQTEVRAAG